MSFTGWLAEVLDAHQCSALSDDGIAPAFRATFLPTFHHAVLITLRCPPDEPAFLSVISTEDVLCHRYIPPPRPSAPGKRRRQPDPPPPLTFPWPLAWWALPGTPPVESLFQRAAVVPPDALARWRAALSDLDLLLPDAPADNGRDGMVTIGEVLLPRGAATFSAWHPPAGSPWERFFTAMLDICAESSDDALVAERLSQLRRYT
jgi:hypothetical protein